MKRAVALVAALLLLVLAPPAYAVDEGVPDGDRHPNVGLLGFDLDGNGPMPAGYWCSGSVLSDRHFLTAAHCITARPAGRRVGGFAASRARRPTPVHRPGPIPGDLLLPLTVAPVRGGVATVHPDFDPDRLAHDLAVVTFPAGSFAGVEPIEVARTGLLDRQRKRQSLRLVGYGSDPERGDGDDGARLRGLSPDENHIPRPADEASGRAERRTVLRATPDHRSSSARPTSLSRLFSEGGDFSTCLGPYFSQRLDTRSERRFLARFVRLH